MAIKESRIFVKKVWGYEFWFVNRDEYCGKFLFIDQGAICSTHCHKVKIETFFCVEGQAILTIEGKKYDLHDMCRAKTILPGEYHTFTAPDDRAVIIEVSTHHEDADSYRLDVSQEGTGKKWEMDDYA